MRGNRRWLKSQEMVLLSLTYFFQILILFSEASLEQAKVMADIKEAFCLDSGQKINTHKSLSIPARILQRCLKMSLASPLISHYIRFWDVQGVPVIHGRLRSTLFEYTVAKIRKRL